MLSTSNSGHIQCLDTLDHKILLSRLHLLGVRDLTLSWFTSYLFDRSSSVQIYNYLSSPSPMKYGIPLGWVLVPSLLSIYLYPKPSMISKYQNIYYHLITSHIFLIYNIVIFLSPTTSNLEVLFDFTLSIVPHSTAITKYANYHLFRIKK